METRDRASCDSVEGVKAKKKHSRKVNQSEPSKPLLVDEEAFTDLITKMVNTPPLPLKDVPRRRNPKRDPRYLPVFPALKK